MPSLDLPLLVCTDRGFFARRTLVKLLKQECGLDTATLLIDESLSVFSSNCLRYTFESQRSVAIGSLRRNVRLWAILSCL
jgi:hypothetical protein